MRLKLILTKQGQTLSQRVFEVVDAASFGVACTEIWGDLERRSLERATSVGEFMDLLNDAVFDQLAGVTLSFKQA